LTEHAIEFPCDAIPDSPAAARLLGIYPQRIEGLFMQRVKTPGGRLAISQWRGLAELAEKYSPDVPLHATSRQAIEFHGLSPAQFPSLQREVDQLGLSPVGACGDTLRSITISPESGLSTDSWDVAPLGVAMASYAQTLPFLYAMPRKFKVALAGSEYESNRPWINDLGLIAQRDGTFRVLVAGSLGAKPGVGLQIFDSFPKDDILPLFGGLLRLFNVEGDCEHRTRARLRHVRQRLGDTDFKLLVQHYYEEEKERFKQEVSQAEFQFKLLQAESSLPLQQRFHFPQGDIQPNDALAIAEAAESMKATLRLGVEHDLYVFGESPLDLSSHPLLKEMGPSIVACPGTTWCARAVAETRTTGARIRKLLESTIDLKSPQARRLDGLNIALTGCPNNCAHASIADIGLLGRKTKVDGKTQECFRLLAGGGRGRLPILGREMISALSPEDAAKSTVLLLLNFLQSTEAVSGDLSFAEFIADLSEANSP
jgi:sulfite reductase beta subunit-like hemoprotein